jgi:hypothetical protein
MRKFGFYWSVLALTVRVLLAEPETNDNAAVVLPSQMSKLPPFAGDSIYAGWYLPATNGTYGLTLMPVDESKRVKEVWLHKVTMTIPGRTPEEMLRVGASMGFTNSGRGKAGWELRNGDAVLRQNPWHSDGSAYYFMAEGQKLWDLLRGEYDVNWWKKGEFTNHYEFAKAEMQKLGMWPDYPRDDWPKSREYVCEYPEIDPEQDIDRRFHIFGGNIEGAPLRGRFILHIGIMRTKHLKSASGRLCRTQRYAKVKAKSVEQAFDELNKGYGSLVPVRERRAKVEFRSLGYGVDGLGGNWMIPVYKFFEYEGNGRYGRCFYIPAMESEYFEDPTRQVVADAMLSQAKEGERAVDPAKVAALRFDPDEYIARVTAEEKARQKVAREEAARRLVEESDVIVIGTLARGKAAGEWEVRAQQTIDLKDWLLLPESQVKQLKEPVLLSSGFSGETNGVPTDEELSYGGHVIIPPVKAEEMLGVMAYYGDVFVFRKALRDEVWGTYGMVASWRSVPEERLEASSLDSNRVLRLSHGKFVSHDILDEPNGAFYGSSQELLECIMKSVEDVKKRHASVIAELSSKSIEERIRVAKGGAEKYSLETEWCLTVLAKDPEVRVRRELASSPNPSGDMLLYLMKNDSDEEVRVRAKSAYEKNYGKLLPRKEDKNHK